MEKMYKTCMLLCFRVNIKHTMEIFHLVCTAPHYIIMVK